MLLRLLVVGTVTFCATFAFDQIGSGTRVAEAKGFYAQHPHWSLLGKMVADTRAALASHCTWRLWTHEFGA